MGLIGTIAILVILIAIWHHYYIKNTASNNTQSNNTQIITTPSSKWEGRKKYKVLGIIMFIISILYASDYIFGHILFASGSYIKTPNISDIIMMLYALLFAVYGFVFVYLYKH